jgi:hypothetical protein
MNDQTIENQIRMYLFDLNNSAREHGFKADDKWELNLATDRERSRLQNNYNPSIATKILPESLLQVFRSIKERLHQQMNTDEEQLDMRTVLNRELTFIVAYNPKRMRS